MAGNPITRSMVAALGVTAMVSAAALGCSSDDGGSSAKTVLTVSAAASLKTTFTAIEAAFEKQYPDIDVRLNFDGSSALVTQIKQGAAVDVLATADESTMDKVSDLVNTPQLFARNTLVIATAPGNPQHIADFASLRNPDIRTVICAVEVPCGAATAEVEKNTGITLAPKSEESSVTAVLAKVIQGEADAGLVYVTDAKGARDRVATVDDAAFAKVVNNYPIATLKATTHSDQASEFVEMVRGQTGQAILAAAGFSAAS